MPRSSVAGFRPAAEIRHVLPVGLRPPKFQSVNPPSLRSIGIPKTPDREAESWSAEVPGDDWIVAAQVPVPSTAATGRRTPPVAVVPGIVEGAIVVAAAAARKGRKPKVVRAGAATIPSIGRFQSRSFSSAEALCGDEIFQIRPLPIGRDMPSARTQAPRIVHGIPVVKPAILRQ